MEKDSLGHRLAVEFASECGSQNKAAEVLGLDSGTYSRICRGEYTPTIATAKKWFLPAGIWIGSWAEPLPRAPNDLAKAVRKMRRLRDPSVVAHPHLQNTGS